MIDSKIKNFNEFEKVNEAFQQRDRTSYECYMITFDAFADDYNEGEDSKPYTTDTVRDSIQDYTLDGLLKKVASDYSHWIIEPINKENSYYDAPFIRCSFGPVNRNWEPLSKSEEAAWKEGSFTAYETYVNLYIRKIEDVPSAEAFKFVGKP